MSRNLVLLSKTVGRENLSSIIQNLHVQFAKRQENVVAFTLAVVATSQVNYQIFHEIPTCIAKLIEIEMK